MGLSDLCCHYTCLNHVLNPKPNPEPYLLAMDKIATTPSNCIVIEYSKSGINSAKSAGLYTIAWVKGLINLDFAGADKIIKDLDFLTIQKSFDLIKLGW
ncbi:MAG: HAD family hydrolase [Polaribacter sp.]